MIFVFGDCELDPARRELRRAGEAVHVEPQVFDVLVHLLRHRDRVISKDELIDKVWNGRVVSEATLTSRIGAARRAIGDSGGEQTYLQTIARRGFRFVGKVREEATEKPSVASQAASQKVTFCRTPDAVHLAVATSGEGPLLVKATNWLSHLEYDWRSPVWAPLLEHLAERFRVVRYDGRGLGLSDSNVPDLSFDAYVRDLETVVDSFGLERFALLGISGGAAVSIAYAARHPEHVSRLVLFAGFAHGWFKRGSAAEIAQREALIAMIRHGWGQDNPAFHRIFTSLFVPGGTLEQHRWFEELQRISVTPDNAVRLARMFGEVDVAALLPQIKAKTLVLHSRHDARVPFEQGLLIARGIPDARFVALESRNHLILSGEPEWSRFVREISDFVLQ